MEKNIYVLLDDHAKVHPETMEAIKSNLNDLSREKLGRAIYSAFKQLKSNKCLIYVMDYGGVRMWMIPVWRPDALRTMFKEVSFENQHVYKMSPHKKVNYLRTDKSI